MKITITGQDIMAIVIFTGTLILKALGHNDTINYILLGTAAAYGLVRIGETAIRKK